MQSRFLIVASHNSYLFTGIREFTLLELFPPQLTQYVPTQKWADELYFMQTGLFSQHR